jgi:hypothetical protein
MPSLLPDARSGSPGVDLVVTALMLAASRRSVSVPSRDRTNPSATRTVRACGDEQVRRDARVETRIRTRASTGDEYGFVSACLREGSLTRKVCAGPAA